VDGLVAVGMNLLCTLYPASGPASVRDPFLAYCRISRALRLTVLIEMPLAALADEGAPGAMAAEPIGLPIHPRRVDCRRDS
jgi:hypothetical protein